MNKTSQLAIFMILGIVSVILIGLALFGISSSTEKGFVTKQSQLGELFIGKGKYTTYIKSCLDQATKQGLVLAGKQGGAIYDNQTIGGKQSQTSKYYELDGIRIHYSLLSPTIIKLPEYPYIPSTITLTSSPFLAQEPSIYGVPTPFISVINNPFIPLCDRFGPNNDPKSNVPYCGNAPYIFDTENINDHNSVQEYLGKYITQKTNECIKLETLPELQGYNIIKQNFNVDIILTESSVVANLNMTLALSTPQSTLKETLPVIDISGISVEKHIRLKHIFELLARMRQEDSKNIFFEITNAQTLKTCGPNENLQCLKPGMIVSTQKLPNNDYVVKITDTESLIDGKEFSYQVIFQNRNPTLDYLTAPNLNPEFSDYNAVLVEGMTLVIDPYGYDPDEDNHEQGFMKDYYYYEAVDGYTKFDADKDNDGVIDCIPTTNSGLDGIKDSLKSCLVQDKLPSAFKGRKVTYKLTQHDAGEHIIRVKVCDNTNNPKCDWQDVKIFVIPLLAFGTDQNGNPFPFDSTKDYQISGYPIYSTNPSDTVTLGVKQTITSESLLTPQPQEPTLPDTENTESQQGSETQSGDDTQDSSQSSQPSSQQGYSSPTQPSTHSSSQQTTPIVTPTIPYDNTDVDILISRALSGTKLPYEMYYFENKYLIVKNTINNQGPEVVPETDAFRQFAEKGDNGKPNLYIQKKIYGTNQQSALNQKLATGKNLFFIYIPEPCTQGAFFQGYCHFGDKCYYNMNIVNHNFQTAWDNCPSAKLCTETGCK
ncbi:hypothetical protein HY636_04355 [Candidatus Woesearchaeota archaeon]|nr:hypothetical protein [Candidatus Woesearchaeota archaeon]